MQNDSTTLMTTGNINRVIFTVATPLMLNNLIKTLYNLTDGLYVAQVSSLDFAATSFTWPLTFLFISIGLGIGVAATGLMAQAIGARRFGRAKVYASNTLLLTFGLGTLLSIIGYLSAPFFIRSMGASGAFYDKSVTYLQINFIGLFFDMGFFGYQSILNAQGKTKTLTIISGISSVINLVLDPIFIFKTIPILGIPGLNWGIAGAAWATVIAKVILLYLGARAVQKESRIAVPLSKWRWNGAAIQVIAKVGTPSALGMGGAALGFTILNSTIAAYGTATLSAYSMVNRISDLLDQPQMGIGAALTAIIGQNMGAQLFERSQQIFKRALVLILSMSVVSFLVIFFFQDTILSFFIKEPTDSQLWIEAAEYLRYTSFIIFFMGLFSAYTGYFQGCGQTRYSMVMSVGRLWVLRLPIIWALAAWTDLGATGVWIAMLLSNALTVLYATIVYKVKDWSAIRYGH